MGRRKVQEAGATPRKRRSRNQPERMIRAMVAGTLPDKDRRSTRYEDGARHRPECGDVGDVGDPGDLGENALA